eukprot:TRINITY_DN264_c0_g1_i1.p1 TRINITY_DN264_c0_g1~~TRINITY_DN264_c0_g1_i1.p1  ORF type:complete len:154 (-),score=51.47 TRINITY_DN264_c0_g1_i1:199-660(-)
MIRCLVAACLLVATGDAATLRSKARRTAASWPSFHWPSLFAAEAPSQVANVTAEKAEPPKVSIQSVKEQVVLSASFGHKTQEICHEALPEEMARCRELAGDRLFCALLKRNADKYQAYGGIKEEQQRCKETNIMDTAADAARDERLQKDAANA